MYDIHALRPLLSTALCLPVLLSVCTADAKSSNGKMRHPWQLMTIC